MARFIDSHTLQNGYMKNLAGVSYTSPTYVTPSWETVFHGVYDPGHSGVVTTIEYYFYVRINNSGSGDTGYRWQYKEWGGSWVQILSTTTGTASGNVECHHTGLIETVELTCPIQFRLAVNNASINVYVVFDTTKRAAIQAWGTV